jgi:hypothetical protein
MDKTPDGGMIMIGQTTMKSNWWSALVTKINPCGETEWCRIFSTPQRQVYGLDIQTVPGGGSIAMVGNWGYDDWKNLWLLRLDDNGDIVWQQAYATDTIFYGGQGRQLLRTADTNFIITGSVYSPDSGQTKPYKERPLIVKVAPDGTSVFQLAWGVSLGFVGSGWNSVADLKHNVYTGSQHVRFNPPFGKSPCINKTSGTGQSLFYRDMTDTCSIGGVTTIDWFADSTLVLGMIYLVHETDTIRILGAMKTDSLGTPIKFTSLLPDPEQQLNDAEVTFDNKVVMVNSEWLLGNWHVYAFKLNSNLDFDSVYTHPFTYDSLCPHAIVSDTVSLESCHRVVVGLEEAVNQPSKSMLHVYPNPAGDRVTVEMPQNLVIQNHGPGITSTTTFFHWDRTRLEVFNLDGKLMFSRDVPGQELSLQVDVSAWFAGIYRFRLVYMGNTVAGQSLVVRR